METITQDFIKATAAAIQQAENITILSHKNPDGDAIGSGLALYHFFKNLGKNAHQTKIYWKGSKPTGEHNGLIKLKDGGKFIVNDDKLVGGEFVIDMNSIVDTDIEDEKMNAKLVGHLKSEDFFYVDSFPEAKFVITKVSDLKGDAEFTNQIDGNLTIKGITKGISFKANVKIHNGIVSATSEEFVLDRTQWNVNYGSKSVFKELQDKFINDEFSLVIDAHSM